MTHKIDNHTFYKLAYEEHGISAKGLKWTSKRRQFIRFDVLMDFIKDEIHNSTVCDVGCGYGDLLEYFEMYKHTPKDYLGIDCEEFMCEISAYRFTKNSFLQMNILEDELPAYDYYLCSGALNIMDKNNFFKGIKNCFNASKKGFAFNFLVKDPIHKCSKEEILGFCNHLTKNISIRGNYLDNDYSILLKK